MVRISATVMEIEKQIDPMMIALRPSCWDFFFDLESIKNS